MRVVIAPDGFGGTLTSAQAADAIAAGWRRGAPEHRLVTRPLADGGTGFVEVLLGALESATAHLTTVTGPLGEPVDAKWLVHEDVAYVESAEAIGLHLVPADRRAESCETATTRGVGELILAARDAGVSRVVIGLGGTATTDGGRGALAVLDGPLPELFAAVDVENPLLGPHGAATTFGPQKGADEAAVARLEARLAAWADEVAARYGNDPRDEPGAGAAGGLGFALLAVGASVVSGAEVVQAATRLDHVLDRADLVITGEGSFDWQSLRGKLVTSVARAAAERGVPCVVLAGQVSVGRRQAGSVGVAEAHSVAEHAGSVDAALFDPVGTLADLAEHVGRQWR
ncbi:glycerate kinase family protein [Actinokineospora globicatena]|uniref:glycerate kinase family protein n=1 Tax=Actinokineospora globicatena TaxID=103729 RepID=UPI0020A3E610|nr:glycerate kinase [Actinokineospora globicatena]MCP2302484.1 glycerate kinase [Actinokineospora globicatena]GLW75832.1 putative glycerate kinase [Actinokineospora globicatena]GLW82670.1 putative glycerate kinase [Actinokineospora globicatena]